MRRSAHIAIIATATFAGLSGLALVVASPTSVHAAQVVAAPPVTLHAVPLASQYWGLQHRADCLPMSARVIIGTMTGRTVSERSIERTAARVTGYNADGTVWITSPNLLSMYGVASRTVSMASLDMVRASLDQGAPVLVDIDPQPLWTLQGFEADPGSMHAVVVSAVDDVAHTVTVVDSALPEGMSETVPAAIFLTAWDSSDRAGLFVESLDIQTN